LQQTKQKKQRKGEDGDMLTGDDERMIGAGNAEVAGPTLFDAAGFS
jgi:hypothetical protein